MSLFSDVKGFRIVGQSEPRILRLVYHYFVARSILHNFIMLRVRGEAGLVLETGDNHAADKVKRPR